MMIKLRPLAVVTCYLQPTAEYREIEFVAEVIRQYLIEAAPGRMPKLKRIFITPEHYTFLATEPLDSLIDENELALRLLRKVQLSGNYVTVYWPVQTEAPPKPKRFGLPVTFHSAGYDPALDIRKTVSLPKIDFAAHPHVLVSGQLQRNRSIAIQSLVGQLALDLSPTGLTVLLQQAGGTGPMLIEAMTSYLEWRQSLLEEHRSKTLDHFNAQANEEDQLPHIAIVVEEVGDLLTNQQALNQLMTLTAQGRAVGFHVLLFTADTDSQARAVPARIRTNMLHIHQTVDYDPGRNLSHVAGAQEA